MVSLLLADSQVLTREGIVSILAKTKDIRIVGLADDADQLDKAISKFKPDVVVIDYHTRSDFNARLIKDIRDRFNSTPILILSNRQYKQEITEFANHGIGNYVSKECGSEELVEAIYATAKGREFFCKCTLQTLSENKPVSDEVEKPVLTNRETEIIHLIAEGMTNKEIAEQLFLSFHTVKTHRKNIIKKLGFSFKNAGELTSLIRSSN